MRTQDHIAKSIKEIDIENHTDMAYNKNEEKLKEYLKKKNDFKQSDKQVKESKPKPSNDKNIRRG